jgi:hypothetical protein
MGNDISTIRFPQMNGNRTLSISFDLERLPRLLMSSLQPRAVHLGSKAVFPRLDLQVIPINRPHEVFFVLAMVSICRMVVMFDLPECWVLIGILEAGKK